MSITLIGAASAAGGSVSSFDSTGAKLLVVGGSSINNALTLTDNKSNSWLSLIAFTDASHWLYMWACLSPQSVGTGHSFTMGGSYSNIHVAAFDTDFGVASITRAAGTSPGSIASFSQPRLFLTNMDYATAATPTIDSGFTVSSYRPYLVGYNLGGALGYKIQSSAGGENPAWSVGIATGLAEFRVAVEPGSGGSAVANRGLLTGGRR